MPNRLSSAAAGYSSPTRFEKNETTQVRGFVRNTDADGPLYCGENGDRTVAST